MIGRGQGIGGVTAVIIQSEQVHMSGSVGEKYSLLDLRRLFNMVENGDRSFGVLTVQHIFCLCSAVNSVQSTFCLFIIASD